MPSFSRRHYTPHRWQTFSKRDDDLMEDVTHTSMAAGPKSATTSGSLALVPSDGSLLDYFDLPSPPSTPHRPTHSLSYSSLNSFASPATSPLGRPARSPGSSSLSSVTSASSSASSSPRPSSGSLALTSTTTLPRWPTASQRITRLPTRPRSRSASSTLTSSPPLSEDITMSGVGGMTEEPEITPLIRQARRTPYYPPNSSRSLADRTRVYMNRGPHFVPNWTPLASLPRHVQLQIEERMVRFTAL